MGVGLGVGDGVGDGVGPVGHNGHLHEHDCFTPRLRSRSYGKTSVILAIVYGILSCVQKTISSSIISLLPSGSGQ